MYGFFDQRDGTGCGFVRRATGHHQSPQFDRMVGLPTERGDQHDADGRRTCHFVFRLDRASTDLASGTWLNCGSHSRTLLTNFQHWTPAPHEKSPNHFWKGLFKLVAWDGIEPSTRGFSIPYSVKIFRSRATRPSHHMKCPTLEYEGCFG